MSDLKEIKENSWVNMKEWCGVSANGSSAFEFCSQSSEIRNWFHGFVYFAFFGLKEVEFWHAFKADKRHVAIQAY